MPRSRPASDPLSFHRHTGQYYVTRAGKRVYLGADHDEALQEYHRLALGLTPEPAPQPVHVQISAKELANRFLEAQQANWRNPDQTLKAYRAWLERFLTDHRRLQAEDFTTEMFAAWKLSLRRRKYSPESINHFLCAVRAIYRFGEDAGLIQRTPRLRRVRNETCAPAGAGSKPLYSSKEVQRLLKCSDLQMRVMILLGLNCGFGPKDILDLTWKDIDGDRTTLPRSKTGVCQTFRLWAETQEALKKLQESRTALITRLKKRNRRRTDDGHVFTTRYWKRWSKDAVSHEFRKLCEAAKVPCHGFYRLRHCASTAISLVANPHVQRRFMRHAQLQQQVTYTHVPDGEVDDAVEKAKTRLLGSTSDPESGPGQVGAA